MSDPQEVGEPQPLPESSRLALPPRFTPSPDATESGLSSLTYRHPQHDLRSHPGHAELKLSRKREREVSQEPATPSASNVRSAVGAVPFEAEPPHSRQSSAGHRSHPPSTQGLALSDAFEKEQTAPGSHTGGRRWHWLGFPVGIRLSAQHDC